jgi:hypothetical protein
MALRRKKKTETDTDTATAADQPSVLDRLTALRRDITGKSAVTELIDILIDGNGGDSQALSNEIDEAGEAGEAGEIEEIEEIDDPGEPDPAADDDNA